MKKKNAYLEEHPRAKVHAAKKQAKGYLKKLKIDKWVNVKKTKRTISIVRDENALSEISRLDGCYVLKSDLSQQSISANSAHDRYKDLKFVEWAFRTEKTYIDLRPIFVTSKFSTDGHVLVVMLAYKMWRYLADKWRNLDITVEEGIDYLSSINSVIYDENASSIQYIPEQRGIVQKLLVALNIELPEVLISKGVHVDTRKKLTEERKNT